MHILCQWTPSLQHTCKCYVKLTHDPNTALQILVSACRRTALSAMGNSAWQYNSNVMHIEGITPDVSTWQLDKLQHKLCVMQYKRSVHMHQAQLLVYHKCPVHVFAFGQ